MNASGATGLAFSPVDYNLWHPTTTRGGESGHGVTNTTGTSAVPSVDNSRTPGAEDQDVVGGSWALIADQAYGGASMYFGVEQYTDGLTYYSYGNQGQYGVLDPQAKSQQNLTATTNNIRGNYNVPGGTSGSLVTNSFSLQGYDATDKPTLYFNYWLQSDNDSGKDHDSMTDAARVYVSRDSGKTWELVATNNSTLSAAEVADAELPAYASTSRNASAKANQQVQELFDSSSWRQARVDLNDYAGESNLLLRFDFSTSGQSGHYLDQRVGSPTFGKYLVTDDQSVEGFIADTGSAFGINNDTIYSPQTAQRNTAEGFYIDDILVGFAGRGEMVTGAAGAGSLFTDLMSNPFAQSNPPAQRTKDPNPLATPQLLSGNYQLEIRQGEQYGQLVSGTKPDIAVAPTRSINDPLVDGATIRVGNNIQDGNTITIYDGLITKTFEFDTNGSVASGNVPVTVQTAGVDARAGAWSTALADAIYQAFGPNSRIRISSPSAKFSSGQFVELVPNINSDQIDIVGAEIKSVFGTNPTVTDLGTATDSGFGNDYPVNGIASSLPPMSSGTNGYYRVSGEIGNGPHPDADSDFYQINLLFGEKLNVALTVTGGTGTHYTLVLMRSNGIVMAARDGVLQYVADAASNYYLGVLGDDGEVSTLPYDPLFTFSLTNPPPLASTGNDKFNYQLNISLERAGTSLPRPLSAESYVRRGDSNLQRTQGQIIIENNSIISPLTSGILVDDSERDAAGNSHPGAPRNTPVTKNGWLTGMYLQNNVIAHAGVAGIDINGDPNVITSGISVSGPAAVPFVKVVNNTIYGGTNQGTGIRVSQNASPTLMNNVLVGLATGISVDPSSSSTVVEANLYQNNSAGNGPLGNNSIVVPNGVQLFVDAAQDNFYPAPNSPLIDSSRSTFDDRANYVAVVGPLGISQSPIIAPNFDKFGQLRVDDVNQPGPSGQPGLGQNPFQDRGAIERADFEGGVVIPSLPQDNDGGGIDLDPSVTTIWIDAATVAAPFSILTNFTLRLTDAGIGINDSTVDGTDFLLTQDGVPLIQGQDYTFTYNQNTNEVIFTSVSTFKLDARYQIVVDSAAIVDMAGNPLQNNQAAPFSTINPNVSSRFSSSQVYFTYIVTDGANSAPVNTAPTAVSVNEDSSFTFTGTDTISVNDIDAFLASDGDPTMGSDGGRIQVSLSLPDATLALPGGYGTLTLGDTTNLVLNGGSVSGTGTVSDPLILNGRIVDLREALLGLTYAPPHDYPGTVQPAVPLTIKTEDFGKFGPAATNLATTSTINITVNPVNDVPVFTKGLDQTVDEDTGAHSILTWAMGVSSGPTNESGQALTFLITGNTNSSLFSSGPTVAADGTLSYTLAPNASGFADITIKLKDDGGVANGGIDTSAAQTFRITVNPINDAPTLNQPADSTALEDVPQTVPLSGISAGPLEGSQNLVITAVSSDPLIVPNPTIAYNQGSANAVLTYQSAANLSGGPITITVTVTDNGGTANGGINVITKTFLVNVTAVNDAPTLTVPGPTTVYRDDIPAPAPFVVNLTDIGTGPLEGSQSISSILVTSSDQSIVPNANITQGSVVGGAVQLTIQPLPGQFGTITFTVTVVDSGPNGGPNNDINFVTKTFTVNLLALNHEPSFTVNPPTTTLTVLEDAGQQTINLNNISAGPPREIGQTLLLSAVSQNTSLINNVIVSSIVNGVATVKYTPVANAFGQTTIRITLQDSGGTNAGGDDTYFQDITINVTPVNDVPTLNIIPNQPTSGVLLEGAGEQTINLSGITTGPTNESNQTLTMTAAITSGNANLVNNFVFSAVNGNGQATLKYTPVGDEFGTATVTVTVTDGGINGGPNGDVNVTTRTFTITVLPVNDRPTLDNISDRASDEDAGQQSIGLTGISVGPTNEVASQTLSFTIVSDNPDLIPNDAGHLSVLFTQGSTTGTILYTSTANASGIANITVTMKDNGGAANGGFDTIVKTFKITILPVPDAPTNITLVGDTLLENLPGNTLVGTLSTTDADLPSDSFTYSVVGGTGLGLFQISGSQLRTSQGLNYEGTVPPGTYTVVIRSTDSSTLFFEKEFTIHVIDVNEPATAISVAVNPISNLPNSIPENQPVNSVVGTLVAVDPDSGDHSTFTLVTGAGADDNALFKIVNGQLVANTVFNYEVKNSYTVRVRATDSQGVTFETPITITITNVNEAPTNINLSNSTVVENTAAGTVVGAFDAVDPDANETFTYALVSGPGSTNNAKFTINANGELEIATPPNYEDPGHFYTIRVRVTDGGLQSFEKTFTITILNVNEAPTALTLSALNINENMAVGSTVGTFATADQDVPETFEYSLVTGSGSDDNAAFTISGNKLLTAEKFDFESRTSYSVRVRTRDSAGNQLEQVFVITINDTKDGPVVTLSSSSGTTKGRKAVTVDVGAQITDIDSTNFDGGKLVVSIHSGEQAGDTISIKSSTVDGLKLKLVKGKTVLRLGTRDIATVSGGVRGIPLTVRFGSGISPDLMQSVLRNITFKGKPFAAERVISVQAFDETGLPSNVANRSIVVT
ncbi:MAG: cadherin domain-containing protein [Planctomycetota bacterium]